MATSGGRDYYDVLGVPRDADSQTLKRAFRELARRYHPDLSTEPGAQDRFKEVAEAYGVLSDPERRAEYDERGARPAAVSVEDLLAGLDLGDLFGGSGGTVFGRGGGIFGRPFDDPFATSFDGGAGRTPARGADVELDLTVPLSAVMTGSTETVTVRRPAACPDCGGTGAAHGTRQTCPRCRGSGRQVGERRRGSTVVQQVTTCRTCGGRGTVVRDPCNTCAGSGRAAVSDPVSFRVPAGTAEGTVFRLPGRGMPSPDPRGRPGDVYVTVRTAADPRFTRQGADLWHGLEIPVHRAVLGLTTTVPGPDGPVPLTVPAGTQPGAVLDVPGLGLPRPDGRGRGSLRVAVTVRVPEHPAEEERALYRSLAALHAPHPPATRGGPPPADTGTEEPESPGTDPAGRGQHRWSRWWRRGGAARREA
ncbi:DnaJ C-terminal domain-containing protein [Kitasatospora sp. DSM 101779]|uniref:DnaJ C-terminal domain-containing protein n=1 Tax=Kitasatospora sp. DSM 101779 TaxID=2853165 RepID=UPI0021DA1975|nr:DnaJ C-terminal domain-containing protein [Kitasatospora sp. DSM 101779]MCU7826434.1 DnaJ domain-containing protein [Kitasatospora sp. DSM 101779]